MTRGGLAVLVVVLLQLSLAGWTRAGSVLGDLSDAEPLELIDADVPIGAGRAADLLLVATLRERLVAGALSLDLHVPVSKVADDHGPRLDGHETLEVGELLQLLLLTDSRTAAKSLSAAIGPGLAQAISRMQRSAAQLGLRQTTIGEESLVPGASRPREGSAQHSSTTSLRDVMLMAIEVAGDEEIRRRLSLDGVPIADGSLIVRAVAPLIWTSTISDARATATNQPTGPAIALEERDGLTLLAVADTAPPNSLAGVRRALDEGFSRYRRVVILRAGQAVGRDVEVSGGIIARFKAVAAEQIAVTTRRDSSARLGLRLQLPDTVHAPIEVDEPIGELIIERDERLFAVVPLVAPMSIAPSRWLDTARRQ